MDNQHKHIKGYRDLTQEEIDLMNEGKVLAEQVGAFVAKLEQAADTDKRFVAIGKTGQKARQAHPFRAGGIAQVF